METGTGTGTGMRRERRSGMFERRSGMFGSACDGEGI